jgi:homoserine O-acetyltransferase
MLDPRWRGGRYYGREKPVDGLSLAREIGTITYRSDLEWSRRFGREWRDGELFSLTGRFQVESYVQHQGEGYAERYDANSYLYLSRAMDLHDLGRGRGGLIPPFEIHELADAFREAGRPVELLMLDLDTGHDSFLVNPDVFTPPIRAHLEA